MAREINLEGDKPGRDDIFFADPRKIVVKWERNLSRGGIEPMVDDELIALARDMAPPKATAEAGEQSSGQINPIPCRLLPDRRPEAVGGFRRLRAALWLVEEGGVPDFRIKFVISKMNDSEAALKNLCENVQRKDPSPLELAGAVRTLTESYGLAIEEIAARLKRSVQWLEKLVEIVVLPAKVQAAVSNGEMPLNAALELAQVEPERQAEMFDELAESGEKVTAKRVREKRRAKTEEIAEGQSEKTAKPLKRTPKELIGFIESRSGPLESGNKVAVLLLDFLDGRITEEKAEKAWNRLMKPMG